MGDLTMWFFGGDMSWWPGLSRSFRSLVLQELSKIIRAKAADDPDQKDPRAEQMMLIRDSGLGN
jgi:hypothetical protein